MQWLSGRSPPEHVGPGVCCPEGEGQRCPEPRSQPGHNHVPASGRQAWSQAVRAEKQPISKSELQGDCKENKLSVT